jgi:hypothetical protein
MSLESVPDTLRHAIEDDLQPVRPLHPIWRRTLVATATMAVILAFSLATASLRPDIHELPMWLSWGCSTFQLALGVLLIALAMREAVPGAGVPGGSIRIAAATALTMQILVGIATSVFSPAVPMPGRGMTAGVGCLQHESLMAMPTFVVTMWLVFRALPMRAPTAGLLGGAGAAVASDAVLHLLCPMSNLLHVLVWHTGAVILFMALGWIVGWVWARLRWPRMS